MQNNNLTMDTRHLYDTESEGFIINIMLKRPLGVVKAFELLTSDDFTRPSYQILFNLLSEMVYQGISLSPDLIMRQIAILKADINITALEIEERQRGSLPLEMLPDYARKLRETTRRRHLAFAVNEAMTKLLQQSSPDTVCKYLTAVLGSNYQLAINSPGVTLTDGLELVLKNLQTIRMDETPRGITCFSPKVAEILYPLHIGSLSIVAARPAMGKTAFAFQWAIESAYWGKNVAYFSLEMSVEELAERFFVAHAGVIADDIHDHAEFLKHPDEILEKMQYTAGEFPDISLQIIRPKESLKAKDIVTYCQAQTTKPIDLVFVDYLGLMSPNERRKSEYESITAISRELKMAAVQANVPLVAVHQLNRAGERYKPRRPTITELRGSGQLEQDASNIILLYRPGYYHDEDGDWSENILSNYAAGDDRTTEIIIAKQRNGQTGTRRIKFNAERTWFENI